MAEPKRHLSRWRPVAPATATATPTAPAGSSSEAVGARGVEPDVSLRYLNEFVGKLQCASALLDHKLYPDAKEVTESMGVFNAVRKYVLQDDQEAALEARNSSDASAKADGIVVVGDGSTPRTAAMFAHRLRHWKSYSVDPAMEFRSSERSVGWESITNLVVIRNKIENVHITLRRAIVVLVHAHVTLEQALSAVDAERIIGVVTLPCCNWFSKQETLFARQPDLVYDDFSILSDKREVRLWVDDDKAAAQELVISDAEAKVCIRKVFCAGCTLEEDPIAAIGGEGVENAVGAATAPLSERDEIGAAAGEARCAKALEILAELLTHSKTDETVLSRELPAELLSRLSREMHILVLDSSPQKKTATAQLLKSEYAHVYVLGEPEKVFEKQIEQSISSGVSKTFMKHSVTLPLIKLAMNASEEISEHIQGVVHVQTRAWTSEDLESNEDVGFAITFEELGSNFAGLDWVVDNRFLYHGFRGESRNAPLFRTLCSLVHQVASATTCHRNVSFVCVTPRKNWRKKDYLSHVGLQFEVLSVPVKQQLPTRWDFKDRPKRDQELTFVFCCKIIHRGDADRQRDARELETQQDLKAAVLAMKRTLQADLGVVRATLNAANTPIHTDLSVQQALELAATAAEIDPNVVSDRTYVQILGKITNVRRYTKGMAFLSLEPPFESESSGFNVQRQPLQAFLHLQELHWNPELFQDALQMVHPGDVVSVLGFYKKSERGTPLLSVAAIEFVRGEFEAYA